VARALAVGAAVAASLLVVSGAVGSGTNSSLEPKRGGTVVIGTRMTSEPACLNVLVESCSAPLDLLGEVLLGAYKVRPNGTYRPELAEAEIVARRPFTLLYHIRAGLRLHPTSATEI
jgi:hypothetical protein